VATEHYFSKRRHLLTVLDLLFKVPRVTTHSFPCPCLLHSVHVAGGNSQERLNQSMPAAVYTEVCTITDELLEQGLPSNLIALIQVRLASVLFAAHEHQLE
jgi:hypothetical protein